MSWEKGGFSPELLNLNPQEAVGRTIICEDGIPRRVVEIVGSNRWPWKFVINEQDPESNSGHFVNTLSLAAQILNKPIPDQAAQDAFCRVMQVRLDISKDGSFDKAPGKKFIQFPQGSKRPFN